MACWIATLNVALATVCHLVLPARWAVTGMAGAYTLAYLAGLALTARLLRKKVGGRLDDGALRRTYAKLLCAAGLAAALGWTAARACASALGSGTGPTALTLTAGTLTLALAYLVLARLLKISELRRLPGFK